MKVVHVESGLGNQMFNYVEYLYTKINNPGEECFIETILYEIPECDEVISQWNGFELEAIFGIKCPNIRSKFSDEQWDKIVTQVKESEFWNKNWNYSEAIVDALNKNGMNLENYSKSFGVNGQDGITGRIKEYIRINSILYYWYRKNIRLKSPSKYIKQQSIQEKLYIQGVKTQKDAYFGQTLMFQKKDRNIELIDREVREAFKFPSFTNKKDIDFYQKIKNKETIAIHARRGDFMSRNGILYRGGYFKRAVSYIKDHIKDPVFIFFCDPGSINWCKENEKVFGLNFREDKVLFVDWHTGSESYRDMQLMSLCKHNIITASSFGWWSAFLNMNPDKITISPDVTINTTVNL